MRIRTIKPEFWGDEKLSRMPATTRLLFIALWSIADDAGRLLDSVPQIVGVMHPYADEDDLVRHSRDTREDLARLSDAGRIHRGATASGQRVIQIVNWTRHQKIDKPSLKAALPEIATCHEDEGSSNTTRDTPASESRHPREGVAKPSRPDLRPTTSDQRPGTNDRAAAAARMRAHEGHDLPSDVPRSASTPEPPAAQGGRAGGDSSADPAALLARFEPAQRGPLEAMLRHVDAGRHLKLVALLDGWMAGVGIAGGQPAAPEDVAQAVQEYLASAESAAAPGGFVAKDLRRFVEKSRAQRLGGAPGEAPATARDEAAAMLAVITAHGVAHVHNERRRELLTRLERDGVISNADAWTQKLAACGNLAEILGQRPEWRVRLMSERLARYEGDASPPRRSAAVSA